MIPDPAFGQDLIGQMATCSVKPCIKLDAPSVMLRVRSSEQPKIPPQVELRGAVHTVRVQARIAENGDVTVVSANGESSAINDAVRTAVEKWKFSPAVVDRETRCVDTVFPIAITRTSEVSK
jgi:TonB family protein